MSAQGLPRERARRLRLLLRDGAAASAFAAIALSGQVPLAVTLLFCLGTLLALFGRRPLAGIPGLSTGALVAASLGLGGLFLLGQLDLVIAASSFAGLLTLQRMLSAAEPRTDQQVQLASLLMLTGGAALSGDLLFGVMLFAFALLASLALGLAVVEAAVPDGELVPVPAVVWPLARGVMFALVGALAFFVLFPRMSWNVAARGSPSSIGPATTGFTDTVRLGDGQGTLKSNPRVVARIALSPDPDRDSLQSYWVGRTFDSFDGQEWSVAATERRPRVFVRFKERSPEVIRQKIELLAGYDGRTVVGLEPVVSFAKARVVTQTGPQPARFEVLGRNEVRVAERGFGYLYEARSAEPESPDGELELPEEEHRLALSLPASLDPRIVELGRRVLGDEKRPLEAARKLEAFLKREYRYSLELSGAVDDPLAHFLFDRKEGHCEHFASALTVLLRSQGIPARLASGFFGGERVGDRYVLRAGDAHAWSQVFVPGRGWFTVDATPESYRQSQSAGVLAFLTETYEWLEQKWSANVLDYNLRTQFEGVRALTRSRAPSSIEASPGPPPRAWLFAAGSGLLVYALWRFGQKRATRGTPHPAAHLHDALERVLVDAGLTRRGEEPLESLAARLRKTAHPLSPAVDRATRRYLEARFGGRSLEEGEAAHLTRSLARALEAHTGGRVR